uniref:Cyclic nucleotide-binding domain-containing protein n=2 Tax=Lotharella globosa TaxID=91324 RepID=A0A7S4DRZ7_9EUKA
MDGAGQNFDRHLKEALLKQLYNCHRKRLCFIDCLPKEISFKRFAEYFHTQPIPRRGSRLFSKTDLADRMYLIAYGKVSCDEGNDKVVKGSGSFLGEQSVISNDGNKTYQYTATALDPTISLYISRDDLRHVFKDEMTAIVDFEVKILGTKSPIGHILRHPVGIRHFAVSARGNFSNELVEFWCQCQYFYDFFKPKRPKKREGQIKDTKCGSSSSREREGKGREVWDRKESPSPRRSPHQEQKQPDQKQPDQKQSASLKMKKEKLNALKAMLNGGNQSPEEVGGSGTGGDGKSRSSAKKTEGGAGRRKDTSKPGQWRGRRISDTSLV